MAANRIYIQVDFQQTQAVHNVDVLNQAIAKVGPTTQKASQQASQGISSLRLTVEQAQRSFASIGGAIAGMGLLRGGQQLLEITADIDTLRKTLELWEGSQAAANARFAELRELSKKPGISLEPAIQAYSRLMSVTENSQESVRMIEAFGRALGQMGRGGADLTGVLEQVTQSLSKGRGIMREDLKFIQQYVPQVTKALKTLYGTADTEELQKAGHAATEIWRNVTTELLKLKEVTPGIRKELDLWSQEMRLVGEVFGKSLMEEIKPSLDAVLKASQDLADMWKGLDPETRKLIAQFGKTAVIIGGVATALGLVAKAVIAIGAALTANPLVFALLSMGATVYGTYQAMEGITEWLDKKYGAKVGDLPGGTGIGMFAKAGFAWDLANYRPSAPYFGLEGPARPGLPPGLAAVPKEGYVIPPKPGPRGTTDAEKSAALSLKKWEEGVRQSTSKGLADALADQAKAMSKFMGPSDQLKAELLAFDRERAKQWEDLITRTGPNGEKQQLSAKAQAELSVTWAKDSAIRRSIIEENWRREQIEKEKKYLEELTEAQTDQAQAINEFRTSAYAEILQQTVQMQEEAETLRLQSELRALDASRDKRLLMLESTGEETLAQQIALADQRLLVEQEYVDKAYEINLKLLDLDKARAIFQLQAQASMANMLDSEAYNQQLNALMEIYQAREDALGDTAADTRETNRLKTLVDQNKMIRTEMQKTFEYFQNLAEGVFDALLSKSKSVTQALGDFVKQTFLTVIKSLYSQMIAGILTRLVYGAPAGRGGVVSGTGGIGGSGGGGGGGLLGWLGPILSGGSNRGGFTGLPIPGGGGWGGWGGGTFPGGTPPILSQGGSSGGYALGGGGGLLGGLPLMGGMGGGGPLALLRGLGGLGMKTGLVGEKFGSVPGAAGSNATGVGGVAGGAMLLGGGTLAYMGLRRGGLSGLAMTTAGGALIGAKFGGPVGAVIGGAIGAVAGTIRLFVKGAKEKTRQRIKEIYGVDITSDGILSQVTGIVKQNYGGDMNVGLYSPEVRELVQMYAMTQGATATGMGRPMYPVSWALSGGSASVQPVYSGGSMVANPYVGPTTTDKSAAFIQLNPQQANQLLEGRVVQIIGDNPGTVADASTSAMEPTYRRSREQSSLMEPMTLMN